MSKPKMVFIINAVSQQRCIKRVDEFIMNGYEVEVYGFKRKGVAVRPPANFNIEVIGEFENATNYVKRLWIMYKSLKPVFKKLRKENLVFYYFMLDVAMVSLLLSRRAYIYEESDLMHTFFSFKPLVRLLDYVDRVIIKKSLQTAMTSEGFVRYHYKNKKPQNVSIIPNRLNASVLDLPMIDKTQLNLNKLRFAYVGHVQYKAVFNFASVLLTKYPQHEFHFYGNPIADIEQFLSLKKYDNAFFHGSFSSPNDLPAIYANIDIVVATYDTESINIRFAEPNKLYEAIYFETPIVVSTNTYLSEKVSDLGIGYAINAMRKEDIVSLINGLTLHDIQLKREACMNIPKKSSINLNEKFFNKLITLTENIDSLSKPLP